jgi:UDPglucose 6-dehydrogenase
LAVRIAMIGSGYVGLVSSACFSEFGHRVTCVDRDAGRIELLAQGEFPIYEPGLDRLVERNAQAGRLVFTTELVEALREAEVAMIAVGTPSRRGDGAADLSFVYAAAREIAAGAKGELLVVTKSTVPVGTAREVARILREVRPDLRFDVASNPEFLREGSAIEDFLRPDRVICGTSSQRAQAVLRQLYRPLFLNETPLLFTTLESAELIKYASNCFLATKITFVNEMADYCEAVGADVQEIARGMGLDRRIGSKFLHAGPGFGGSCFPKDARALVAEAHARGLRLRILESVVEVNDARKRRMADRIAETMGGDLRGKAIAILGFSFKPNTDDVREAPSLQIVPLLQQRGAAIRGYDPKGMPAAGRLLPGVIWCQDAYGAMDGADALVILTEWNEFRALDLDRTRKALAQPLVIDLRNIYRPDQMAAAGLRYTSVGRRAADPTSRLPAEAPDP